MLVGQNCGQGCHVKNHLIKHDLGPVSALCSRSETENNVACWSMVEPGVEGEL